MIRLLVALAVTLIANAIGLILAAVLLDDVTLSGAAFVIAILIFSAVEVVAQPLIIKIGWRHAQPVTGASALLATFLGLVVTTLLSEGLQIQGVATWVLATVIVWAAAMIAALLLPVYVFKRAVNSRGDQDRRPGRTW